MCIIYIKNIKDIDKTQLSKEFEVIINDNNTLIHNIIKTTNHNFIIELDNIKDLNYFLDNYKLTEYISSNYTNNNLQHYFTSNEIILLGKINKKFNNLNITHIGTIKIYNVHGLKKLGWSNTIDYLYNKCNELNIEINNEKLLILYQILYPQYINLMEINLILEPELEPKLEPKLEPELEPELELESELELELEPTKEPIIEPLTTEIINSIPNLLLDALNTIMNKKYNIGLIKRSSCKLLLDGHIICIENTYLKKNRVKVNKYDPHDRIPIIVGKKFKLSKEQYLNFFYIVEY